MAILADLTGYRPSVRVCRKRHHALRLGGLISAYVFEELVFVISFRFLWKWVRIAHLKWLNGFICTKIYYCFLSGAYWVSFSGMVVVRDAHPELNSRVAKLGGCYLLRVALAHLLLSVAFLS